MMRTETSWLLWGVWSLRLADFMVVDGVPRVTNERTFQPGQQRKMYESHGFSPDGRQLLFSGNLERGQEEIHADIYLFDVQSGRLTNLTGCCSPRSMRADANGCIRTRMPPMVSTDVL